MAQDGTKEIGDKETANKETANKEIGDKDVKIKAQVYKDPRPAELFDRHHARVRRHPPERIYEVVRSLTVWIAIVFFRTESTGLRTYPTAR